MPRYAIYGTENPEAIERIVQKAMKALGFQVHISRYDLPEWDSLTVFCKDSKFWADLRVQNGEPRERKVWGSQTERVTANYELALSPSGYGSAVEAGGDYDARKLDELCNALRPQLLDAKVYKSHGVGGKDMRLIE